MTTENTPASNPNSAASATNTRGKGITSLILGIVSLAAFLAPIFGLFGIAAIIVGFLSRRSEPTARTFALVGIVLGVIGIVVGVVFFIIYANVAAEILQEQGL